MRVPFDGLYAPDWQAYKTDHSKTRAYMRRLTHQLNLHQFHILRLNLLSLNITLTMRHNQRV